ncbi:MAG: hypothetical protein ABI718_16675 [Acidobacteriota bacterium]
MTDPTGFSCEELDEILEAGMPEDLARVLAHSQHCPLCRDEVVAWSEINRLKSGLHERWESPGLWSRIEKSLVAESAVIQPAAVANVVPILHGGRTASALLRVAAVTLLVAALGGITWWTLSLRPERSAVDEWALEESALENVEKAEQAHLKSIEELQKIVDPRLENATTPLMLSYREKLMLLDSAIAECEGQIRMNRSNAQLRKELLAIYTEKQKTMQQLLKEGRNGHGSAQSDIQ